MTIDSHVDSPVGASENLAGEKSFDIEIVAVRLKEAALSDEDVALEQYLAAYAELNKFVGMLGRLFVFVQMDINEKVETLTTLRSSSDSYLRVGDMLSKEAAERQTTSPKGAKALLNLHRAFEFIIRFMVDLSRATTTASVAAIGRAAYDATLARFHGFIIRKAVHLAVHALPNRDALLAGLCDGQQPDEEVVRSTVDRVVEHALQVQSRVQQLYEHHGLLDVI